MMGLNEKDLIEGVKPSDLDFVECSEDWSHRGTPQWVCTALLPKDTKKPGMRADLEGLTSEDRMWSQTDDGACFVLSDDEGPDPSKQWFFCSEPADDAAMVCELVPEWMGSAPDGGHAVWLCSTAKDSD